jgi:hypothetical protein
MNYPQSERNAGNDIDPPDEPTQPPMRLLLKGVLACLPDLTGPELFYLKGAIVDEQEERESKQVLAGQGIL